MSGLKDEPSRSLANVRIGSEGGGGAVWNVSLLEQWDYITIGQL